MSSRQLAIIGGGAAGFFGAIAAAEADPTATITIYEKGRQVLQKVRVSGGGRCNVTHSCFDHKKLVTHYPRGDRWLRPLLTQFDAAGTVRWFEGRGVALKTEADGRMFPTTDSSETIIDCLLGTARKLGIRIQTSSGVERLEPLPSGGYELQFFTGERVQADRVLVATGGYPQAPSYGWMPDQNEPLQTPVPSLFTFNTPDNPLLSLAGVSVPMARVQVVGTKQQQSGPLLITHWGFSGPAVLKLSAWAARELANCNYAFTLRINWMPDKNEDQLREAMGTFRQQHPKKQVTSQNPVGLPARLWEAFCAEAGVAEGLRWADLPGKMQNRLIERIGNSQFVVSGKSTFKDEFVTCGGISLGAIHPQTLESQAHPGLFFAGEVLDVDGVTGGFNFQNAWTTGYVAGKHLGLANTAS
ncbi:BaiN/RdsA family NAD(P)/FAD-dependent oxidoreductase [Fibrivirga algicola]|uniref:NAD(P)/FAD-dependent oxidoreductase n=1 Tax=Fibrivirga algicola TaxID=2950420 RepID=A0ABX0QJ08_9BACT|nr:NAD(P)/FAD-dependent oxidoreductase [Fibrivirga algicola]NID12121.1 NAD(P)/FAD-dependent oxidoreductase [Fibrivirga algicola]